MPGLQDYLAAQNSGVIPGNRYVSDLPYVPPTAAVNPSQNTWIGGGINAGIREMRAMGGSALEGLGRATGWQGLEQWGAEAARNNLLRAEQVGRPDLETAPWKEGGASVIPWAVYQSAKALPTLAGFIGGGMAGAAAAPALGVGAGIAGFGGAALSALPATAGQVYQEVKRGAEASGQEVTPGQAGLALAAGIPSAAIGAVQLPVLKGILGREISEIAGRGAGAVATRMAAAGVEGGLSQVPIAAAQRTIEMGFRPDLSLGQKAHEVVDAAITGGVMGGVFGAGAGGVRELGRRRPAEISNPDLKATIDGQLELGLQGGSGDAPVRPPLADVVERPFERLTDRQLALKIANAEQGATLGIPSDVAMMNRLHAERQLRQPELPLGEGYSDNLTAPGIGRYDLNRPEPVIEPPAVEPPLPLRGGEGEAPAPVDLEARPLRNKSRAQLEQVIAGAEQAEATRPLSAEESAARQAAIGELQARARERAVPPRQLDLGLEDTRARETLADYYDERAPRPQPQGLTVAEQLQGALGKTARLPKPVLDAPDLPAMLDLIDQAASKRNAPRWALDAAEKLGLDGSLDEKLAAAQKRLQDEQMGLERWRGEGAPDPLPLQRAQAEVYELQQRKMAIETMESRRIWQGEGQDGNWVGFSRLPSSDRSIRWTPDRIETELQVSHYADGRSKGWAGYIRPQDFLRLTTKTTGQEHAIARAAGELDMDALKSQSQTPFLVVRDGKIVGHEGRHRMAALAAAGIERVPVVITENAGRARTELPRMELQPQFSSGKGVGVVDTLIPLQRDYTDKLNQHFGPATKIPEPTDTPVFSAATATEQNFTPIADAPLKSVLDRMTRRLGASSDRLRIVQSVEDLPEKVRQSALDQGVPLSDIRGSYSDGIGWLVRDRIRDAADVQEVVAHEMFGHGGAQAEFGSARLDRFSQLFDKAGGLEGVMRIAKRLGADAQLKDYIPEGRTALDKARFFDEMLAQAAGKTDGTMRQTALAWMGKVKQSMISMLEGMGLTDLARRIDTFSELDTAVMLRNMRKAVQAGYEVPADHQAAFSRANASVPEANNNMKEVVEKGVGAIISAVRTGISEGRPALRRGLEMLALSPREIATKYGSKYFVEGPDGFNALSRYMHVSDAQVADHARYGRMNAATMLQFERLPKGMRDNIRDMLNAESLLGLTHGRTWEEHADLHTRPNAPELRKALDEVNRLYDAVRKSPEGKEAYDKVVASHQTQFYGQANAALRSMMQLDDSIPHQSMPSFQTDQLAAFRQADSVHDPREAAVYFKNALDATRKDAWAYVTSLEGQAQTLQGRDRTRMMDQVSPLKAMLLNLDQSIARNGIAPYVHLGRTGDWFVGSVLKTLNDGKSVDPRALKAVKDEAQRRGFDDVSIVLGNDNPNIFTRFETRSQAENWYKFMQDMQKQGHIQIGDDLLSKGGQLDKNVQNHLARMVPAFSEKLIGRLRDSSLFKAPENASPDEIKMLDGRRDEMVRLVRDGFISMLPAESIGRFMARREGAQGFSSDFVRSQSRRLEAGNNAMTALEHGPAKAQALTQAYSEVKAAEGAGTRPFEELADMRAAYNEFLRRDSTPAAVGGSKWADIARSATHSFLTAASPAYAMVQLTQLGVTGLPELGKRFGYMPAMKAMLQAAGPAVNILRTAMQEGKARDGIHGIADMVITRDVLQKANIPRDMQNYLLRMINRPDGIQVGSQSRELGMLADADAPGALRRTAQYANAVGFGAETLTRLVMAMSTYKLAKGRKDLDMLAGDVMTNSMFNFGPNNTSRLLDPRTGPFGPATGVAAVFLRFQSMLIEKLYREMHTAFTKGASAEERAASRRFLAGHMAAMTVLGGTMALPMVNVMARVADKAVDMTQEEGSAPFDVKTAWREWLSDIFGKDMGEIAARGLPRALGVDLSNRIGEQDILPFSRFLTDRRKAEDTIEDLALRIGGAGVATGVNIWDGMADIFLRGDYLQGMTKILPSALRNPTVAYRMGSMGYVDEKNAPLPLSPSARSIAVQALGFTPSEMAEYRDDRQAMLVRKTDLETNAGLIRKHLATAYEQGDASGVETALQRMRNHDRLNPAYAVGPGLAGALAARQRDPLIARALGMPMGANIRDVGGLRPAGTYNWGQ